MKDGKIFVLSVLLSGLFFCTQAQAIDLYGFGSYWDKSDIRGGEWGGGLGISLPLFTEHLRLDGRGYFFDKSDFGPEDFDLTITPYDLGLQAHILPNGPVDPYVLGGASYIYVDSDYMDVDSKWTGYVGAGVDINLGLSLMKLFGEAIYRTGEIERVLGDDIDVSGFTGNVGIKLHF